MTTEQFENLFAMVSANVNNSELIGKDLKKQFDKSVNIESNIALMMDNQTKLFNELQKIKSLLTNK